jgi:hypothetical protein
MSKVIVEMDQEVKTWLLKQVTGIELVWSHEDGFPYNLRLSRESLAALRAAKPAGESWEPVCEETIPTSHPGGDGIGTTVSTECAPDLWGNRQSLQISTWDDSGFYHASIVLPDDIRLCRRRTEGA